MTRTSTTQERDRWIRIATRDDVGEEDAAELTLATLALHADLSAAENQRDEARRAADEQAAEIARLRAQVEAYERQVVAVRVDRAEVIGLTRVTADEARAVAARYDELASEILKMGTQLEATLADLSQARAERDMAIEQRDAAIKHAERLGEENARLKAEDERAAEHLREVLRKVVEEQNGVAICSWCALPTNSDEASKRTHQMTCPKSPIVALYGRAVAALQEARINMWAGVGDDGVPSEAAFDAFVSEHNARIDAILADATATAAVDAYRAQQEVIEAAKWFKGSGVPHERWVRLWNALDELEKVETRRGGGR
jgi:hypothetical protein